MALCSPTPGSVPDTKTKTTPDFWHTGSSVFGVGDFRTWDGLPGEWRLHTGCGRGPLSTHMCDIVRMLCLCGSSGRWRFMGVKHTCGHNALIVSHLVCLVVCQQDHSINIALWRRLSSHEIYEHVTLYRSGSGNGPRVKVIKLWPLLFGIWKLQPFFAWVANQVSLIYWRK